MPRPKVDSKEAVKEAAETARGLLKNNGYELKDGIRVAIDPRLPFMGYSRPDASGYIVVVSGRAVETPMLVGLILHEMSHIYRMQTGHPSHNGEVVEKAVGSLGREPVEHEYQRRIIYELTNNIQDLYADDIAVKIMKVSGILPPDLMSRFLQDWVKDAPAIRRDVERARWENGWTMANNARAIAQMSRHGVEDIDGKAAEANRRFLSSIDPSIAGRFGYFVEVLTNLKENVTEDEYRKLLSEYLATFVEMAEDHSPSRRGAFA